MPKRAAVIGAGLMGSGIARHLSSLGISVVLFDSSEAQIKKATTDERNAAITCTTDINAIANVDYAIEAVFEDLSVKRQVLTQVSGQVPHGCIIASNTSSLLISDLAVAVESADRFIGVHYNNPADINPVVEIIAGKTSNAAAEGVYDWMKESKLAVRCSDTPCFILNRQSLPYINEATRCTEIATPGEIDFVATSMLGVGLGPFAVMNLVGLPVMAASSRNLAVLGRGYEPAAQLQDRARLASPDWEILPVESVQKERTTQIVKRLRGAMIFPGRDILEKALCSTEDLHLICKQALGYDKSSPELLEMFTPKVTEALITIYLDSTAGN